jgi:hypothetical protein
MGMKKAAYDAIVKRLEGTAAWERLSPVQKEARVKLDYKDQQDYLAERTREAAKRRNLNAMREKAEANPTDPKSASLLNAEKRRDKEAIEYMQDYSGAGIGDDIGLYKKGGKVKKMAKGGSVGSASKRADGIATKGKTRGRMI